MYNRINFLNITLMIENNKSKGILIDQKYKGIIT